MEWLQVGVIASLFVAWVSAVLAVLALLSAGKRRDEDAEDVGLARPSSSRNPGATAP